MDPVTHLRQRAGTRGVVARIAKLVAALAGVAAIGGCAGQAGGHPASWYATHDGVEPRGDRIYVCHSFGCARKTTVHYTQEDLAALDRILARGKESAEAERAAIAEAISWAEKKAAPIVGSQDDVGGLDLHNAGVPGQMDCIDEATNTTSVLLLAHRHGMLNHHTVARPVARGFFLDGRYPHATAVVTSSSGAHYAVDSWPEANGVAPEIQPLDQWFSARG